MSKLSDSKIHIKLLTAAEKTAPMIQKKRNARKANINKYKIKSSARVGSHTFLYSLRDDRRLIGWMCQICVFVIIMGCDVRCAKCFYSILLNRRNSSIAYTILHVVDCVSDQNLNKSNASCVPMRLLHSTRCRQWWRKSYRWIIICSHLTESTCILYANGCVSVCVFGFSQAFSIVRHTNTHTDTGICRIGKVIS